MLADWEDNRIRNSIALVLGVLLIALSVKLVYDPAGMVTGGVTGIGIVLKEMTNRLWGFEFPLWLTNVLFNGPLLIAAWKVLGRRFVFRTVFATGLLSLFLFLIPNIPVFTEDLLLAAVFGGVISGAGMGLVLATMSTTGGTDVFCMLLHEKIKHISVPRLLYFVDGAVVVAGIFVFGIYSALYAVLSIYIVTKVSDNIMEGMKFAKLTYIISEHYREISDEILTGIDRGVTGLDARGMYSDTPKTVLFCVVSKKQIVPLTEAVHRIDPKAFVIVTDVREVMGEGFIEYRQ